MAGKYHFRSGSSSVHSPHSAHGIRLHFANFALRKTATDKMSTYPEAASVLNEKFYMDDYLDSFENVTHAIKISRHLVSLLKLGGFILTKLSVVLMKLLQQ